MKAQDHKEIEDRETISAQLIEAKAELTKSRDRQKEMARVIASRDKKIAEAEAKIADLRAKLQTRYEELAAVQRLLLRSGLSGRAKAPLRYLGRQVRKLFAGVRSEP